MEKKGKICVIGMGYVGIPVAAKFAEALTNPSFTVATTASTRPASAVPPFRRAAPTIALAVIALAAIGAAIAGWGRTTPRQVVRVSMAIHEDAALTEQSTLRIAMSRDGRRIVYVGPAAGSPLNRQLWLRDLDALSARPLPGTEGAMAPFFSRDGASIGFFTAEPGDLRVVPTDGGPARILGVLSQIQRTMRLGAVQKDGDGDNGDVGQYQSGYHDLPEGKVQNSVQSHQKTSEVTERRAKTGFYGKCRAQRSHGDCEVGGDVRRMPQKPSTGRCPDLPTNPHYSENPPRTKPYIGARA